MQLLSTRKSCMYCHFSCSMQIERVTTAIRYHNHNHIVHLQMTVSQGITVENGQAIQSTISNV